jgi:hypothetical protein
LGHGDLGSSFLLAMLGASELAGKRRITAGTFDSTSRSETPAWLRQSQRTQAEAIRAQARLDEGDSEHVRLQKELIRRMGGGARFR